MDHFLGSVNFESYPICGSCLQKKMIKLPFVGHGERTTDIVVLEHIDVCGSFVVMVRNDNFYSIIFTNDFSWYRL